VSPLGQRFYVPTKYATAVASPSTLAVDPARRRLPENEEQSIHPLYSFLYVADKIEGLVVIGDPDPRSKRPGVSTLLDGNPQNNFLKRALAFNPDGILTGARRITIAGTYAYMLCDRGLVVVDLDNPLQPKIAAQVSAPLLKDPQGIAVQFRYAFVVDRDGLKILDVSDLAHPRFVPNVLVALSDARNIYVARTYAYVAAGKRGLAIIDVEKPEQPKLDQMFTAGGVLDDVRDIKIGMVDASAFAFVADGANGLRILQILSPEDSPNSYGFSPRPTPKLIATYRTNGSVLAISKGTDRDRAVDESGHQIAVFGRRGARPFTREEAARLYLRDGQPFTVPDDPPNFAEPEHSSSPPK
jgi:LVIVD repeat